MSKSHNKNKNSINNKKNSNSQSQQVRIIGGQYKSRNISFVIAEGLRPTPDRVRETLFNWLMGDIFGATVLDACAGSGVLGFEALSRGADHVTFIESNSEQCRCLLTTKQQLAVDDKKVNICHGKAEKVLGNLPSKSHNNFDLVFLDPPYSLELWIPILTKLIVARLISSQSKIYIEADRPIEEILASFTLIDGYELIKSKKVGSVHCAIVCLEIAG